MSTSLTTITNISIQVVPILVSDIPLSAANPNSGVPPGQASQMGLAPGSVVTIESQRLDLAQLEQLARLKLISYAVV